MNFASIVNAVLKRLANADAATELNSERRKESDKRSLAIDVELMLSYYSNNLTYVFLLISR